MDRVEVFAELIHETDDAYLIEPPGASRVWVPKSQSSFEGGAFLVAEWFAEREGLV